MRVLLAEDSAVYRLLINGHLKDWGFDPVIAEDGLEAWNLLQQPEPPTLALLGWVLPEIDGLPLCRKIRESEVPGRYTYTILLTAKDSKNDLIEGMEAGADDYLVKPFEPLELRARLLAGQRILNLQRELVEARESLRMAATYDVLTRLLNRGEIMALLERELKRCKRECSPLGIVMADIDHFKSINDSFGHLAGDEVLREVAKRLKSDLRVYDGAGRYGGEEFLLILPGCDLPTTIRRATEIAKLVSAEAITIGEESKRVTLSMGAASAEHDQNLSSESFLREADTALYRAKANGRNRVEGWTPHFKT
ncbi:MAG: diguanylate cyclase [Candidatus Sulfotelmatobacter sp.]